MPSLRVMYNNGCPFNEFSGIEGRIVLGSTSRLRGQRPLCCRYRSQAIAVTVMSNSRRFCKEISSNCWRSGQIIRMIGNCNSLENPLDQAMRADVASWSCQGSLAPPI
jgi:hypothetical protein